MKSLDLDSNIYILNRLQIYNHLNYSDCRFYFVEVDKYGVYLC